NHFRSSLEGERSRSHESMAATCLLRPRGHKRSTNTRVPSEGAGTAYTRFALVFILVLYDCTSPRDANDASLFRVTGILYAHADLPGTPVFGVFYVCLAGPHSLRLYRGTAQERR